MAFFDTYKEVSYGGTFISSEEKAVLIENGIPLTILTVGLDEQNKYGPRFVAGVKVQNPETGDLEDRTITFPVGTVDSRDRMLHAMSAWLDENPNEAVTVKLEKVGRSILVRPA